MTPFALFLYILAVGCALFLCTGLTMLAAITWTACLRWANEPAKPGAKK